MYTKKWEKDPGCLHNLVERPAYQEVLNEMRMKMIKVLTETGDHEMENYRKLLEASPNRYSLIP